MVCNKVDEHKIQIAHIVKILFINANEMYLHFSFKFLMFNKGNKTARYAIITLRDRMGKMAKLALLRHLNKVLQSVCPYYTVHGD